MVCRANTRANTSCGKSYVHHLSQIQRPCGTVNDVQDVDGDNTSDIETDSEYPAKILRRRKLCLYYQKEHVASGK